MPTDSALTSLTAAFDQGFAQAHEAHSKGVRVVGMSWPAVPLELVHAAGLRPFVVRGLPQTRPGSTTWLEAGLFSPRIRSLVDRAVAGDLSFLSRVIIPRTSDQDYKCYLYLREFARLRAMPTALPSLHLFDLLQSDGAHVRTYSHERTRVLAADLDSVSGHTTPEAAVHQAIVEANTAREAARRLLRLRHGTPRVQGSVVFPLLGAFLDMPPARYAELATAAAEYLSAQPVLDGPRILLAGVPVESPHLHRTIESHGAIVVAETSPWGSHVAGSDVVTTGDPLTALADKYRTDACGPRQPVGRSRLWLDQALDAGVDGVVVSLPPEDCVYGWDYPHLRDVLDARGVPHVRLDGRQDAAPAPAPEDSPRLARFVVEAARYQEAGRRG